MTLNMTYGVCFGPGDCSDMIDFEVDIPEELIDDLKLEAMEGEDPEEADCLADILEEAREEMSDEALDSLSGVDDYVDECIEEDEDPFEEGYDLIYGEISWSDFDFSNEDIEDMLRTMAVNPDVYGADKLETFVDNFSESYTGEKDLYLLADSFICAEVTVEYVISVQRPFYCTDPMEYTISLSQREADAYNAALFDGTSMRQNEVLSAVLDRARDEIIASGVFDDFDMEFKEDFDPEDFYDIDVYFPEDVD